MHEFRCGHGNNCGGFTEYGRACTGTYGDIPTTNGNGVPRSKSDSDVGTDHILYSSDFEKTEEGRQQLIEKFIRNADVGTCGAGDERALQSTETVLRAMRNVYSGEHQFPRPESHFAIVHVGDEPDGKWSTMSSSNSRGSLDAHNFTDLIKSETGNEEQNKLVVLSYLDALVAHEPTADISVHAIQNISAECNAESFVGYAQLYMAELTNGKIISICNDFANELYDLGQYIISLASEFHLNSSDVLIDTLKVFVGDEAGEVEVRRTLNPNDEYGYFLLENPYRINFMPKSVPKDGSKIRVVFMRDSLE